MRYWYRIIFFLLTYSYAHATDSVKITFVMGSQVCDVPAGAQVFFLGNLPPNYNHTIHNHQSQSVATALTVNLDKLAGFKDALTTQGLGLIEFLTAYVAERKWRVGAGIVALGYSALAFRIWFLGYTLQLDGWWSGWRSSSTLAQLFSMPDQELIKELLCSIDERYTTPKSMAQGSLPLVEFMRDVDREIAKLTDYLFWSKAIARIRCAWCFHIDTQFMLTIAERLDRLAFLRSRVMRYHSVLKINQTRGSA